MNWGHIPTWRIVIAVLLLAGTAFSQEGTLAIENPVGQVEIRVRPIQELELRSTSPVRDVTPEDVEIKRRPEGLLIRCRPHDGARIDLVVDVPYDTSLSVSTREGDIRLNGLVEAADIITHSGVVEITTPWKAMELDLKVDRAPADVSLPAAVNWHKRTRKRSLQLRSRFPPRGHETHGEINVRAKSPRRVVLRDMPIPEDAPFKMHWQAADVFAELFRASEQKELKVRGSGAQSAVAFPVEFSGDTVTFRADTRLVSLSVSVTDEDGAPVTDLMPNEFEVLERGVRQPIETAQLEARRTNLVLLLDWSGSTKAHRELSKGIVLRFAEMLRPDDRIAVHVMVKTRFQLVSELTSSRDELVRNLSSLVILQALDADQGASPIYDSLVLSYAQELPSYRGEHNVLVAITDGLDNRSWVSFDKLCRAASEMRAVIYPIVLHGLRSMRTTWGTKPGVNYRAEHADAARLRLQLLAEASGGKLFPAASMADLEPVYPQFAREMKSLYTVTYYPKNQRLDGKWRKLQVKVRRPDVQVRTRAGYFAK